MRLARAEKSRAAAAIVLVDMHAEATSEKVALGWHLAGRVAAVVGTHTHVVTGDEREGSTAVVADLLEGDAFPLRLVFERAGALELNLVYHPAVH